MFPLQIPYRASPCAIRFQLSSTSLCIIRHCWFVPLPKSSINSRVAFHSEFPNTWLEVCQEFIVFSPDCGGEFCIFKLLRFSYNRWHPCVDCSTVTRTTHSLAVWQDHMPLWLHRGMAATPISCPLHRISVSSLDHRFPLCCNASVVSLAHLDALLATANLLQRPTWARKSSRLLHLMHWQVFEVMRLLTISWYRVARNRLTHFKWS